MKFIKDNKDLAITCIITSVISLILIVMFLIEKSKVIDLQDTLVSQIETAEGMSKSKFKITPENVDLLENNQKTLERFFKTLEKILTSYNIDYELKDPVDFKRDMESAVDELEAKLASKEVKIDSTKVNKLSLKQFSEKRELLTADEMEYVDARLDILTKLIAGMPNEINELLSITWAREKAFINEKSGISYYPGEIEIAGSIDAVKTFINNIQKESALFILIRGVELESKSMLTVPPKKDVANSSTQQNKTKEKIVIEEFRDDRILESNPNVTCKIFFDVIQFNLIKQEITEDKKGE